jgi:hypothetical protein
MTYKANANPETDQAPSNGFEAAKSTRVMLASQLLALNWFTFLARKLLSVAMPGAQKTARKKRGTANQFPVCFTDFAFFQLVGPARRTRFSKSSESPIIRIFSAGAQGWIVMGKPGKEC